MSEKERKLFNFTPTQPADGEPMPAKSRPGLLRRFLYFTGGAHVDLLDRYPWERHKYLALALSVIIASVVSMITMVIFLFEVLRKSMPILENGVEIVRSQPFSPLGVIGILVCAAVWGCIMYFLNWYFLIAMKKGEGFLKNAPAILIKIIFALTMGFMDSLPLRVAIFKDYLPAVKNEMRVAHMEKMGVSEDKKIEDAEVKTQAARENLQRWQAGEPEAINSDPAVIDLRERGAAIQKRDNELRPAYRDANNRAWNAINAAQNTLHSLQLQAASFDQSDGEQGDGLILIQDEIKRLEREIRNRNAEISERNRALADLAAQKKDVEDRINARYQAISAGRAVIGQRILGESERVEAELEAVIQNAKKAQSTSALVGRIFGFDNLVSNDIALAVLTQGKGSLIESEIGKRVWQFSLLLTVVIMFIDLGPVIILLFLDKGACEFAIEQNNLNEHFRLKTETAAFQKNYPEMAQITERDEMEMLHWSGKMEMQKQYVFLEMDLGKEMLQKVFDSYTEFNSILDTMWRRLDQDTIALVARTKEIENEDLKKTTITFREELLRQFEETKNKMMLEFKNFIQSFSLSFPSTSR